MCIKEDLGYFDKDVALDSFLQGKKFFNFVFTFICMIYKWGGDFIGGNFPRGQFSRGKNSGGQFSRGGGGGGAFMGGNIHRVYYHRGEFSGGQFYGG